MFNAVFRFSLVEVALCFGVCLGHFDVQDALIGRDSDIRFWTDLSVHADWSVSACVPKSSDSNKPMDMTVNPEP